MNLNQLSKLAYLEKAGNPATDIVPVANPVNSDGTVATDYDFKTPLGIFENTQRVFIKQKLQIAEVIADQVGCGCLELPNRYQVFSETGELLMQVKEKSNAFERICCQPLHKAELTFYDMRNGAPESLVAMKATKPFKLGCCACLNICRKSVTVETMDNGKFSKSKMAFMGGGFTPKIEIMGRDAVEKTVKKSKEKPPVEYTIRGPTCCVGGLMEMFTNLNFPILNEKEDEVGLIKKLKPSEAVDGLAQFLGDADAYQVEFPEGATNEQKATLLANMFLLDYLFFSKGALMRRNLDGSCSLNLCNLYCCGCLSTCTCSAGGNRNNNN